MYTKLHTVTRRPQHKIYNKNKYLVAECEKLKKKVGNTFFLNVPALQLKWSHVLCRLKNTHAHTHTQSVLITSTNLGT